MEERQCHCNDGTISLISRLLKVLHILLKLPRVTKNKIDSSGIEVTVKDLTENENARVKELASSVNPLGIVSNFSSLANGLHSRWDFEYPDDRYSPS